MTRSHAETRDYDDRWIIAQRGDRAVVDPTRPYACLVEPERTATGAIEDALTVFITNRECPFRCLMCDLWRYTTPDRVPVGSVAGQIEAALRQYPDVRHVKLYNAGSFFDRQAVPPADDARIADHLRHLKTVIVESHPRMVGDRCLRFAQSIAPALQVAMGLETVDPDVLPRLNKRMTLEDFAKATDLLLEHGISVRAFILLRAPFQSEEAGLMWARRSIDYAFSIGVECCVVIPTRAGNGAMERLAERGQFHPPSLASLERVLDYGINRGGGRVFVDLWDAENLQACHRCTEQRLHRLREMNRAQVVLPPVDCVCGTATGTSTIHGR